MMSSPEALDYRKPDKKQLLRAIGFRPLTLALLAVLALLVIAGVAIPVIFDAPSPGPRFSSATPTERAMLMTKQALATFEVQHERFPTTAEGLQILVTNPGNIPDWHISLEKLPLDEWGRPLVYRCPGTKGGFYDLYSVGPDGKDGTADDIWDSK